MAEISDDYVNEVVSNAASEQGIVHWKFTRENFDNIGQNYFGVLIPVVVVGEKNNKDIELHLVLKLAPTDERYRVSGAVTRMFATEIFVYSTVMEEYRKQQPLNVSPLSNLVIPICYYVCKDYCKEAIVMQDMRTSGYLPYTDSMFLDYNHIVVALKALAIFHAHSFIYKHKNPTLYEYATSICAPLTKQGNKRFMQILEDRISKAIAKFENSDYANIFQNLKLNYVRLVEGTFDSVEGTCICHGDIWKENVLFKYEDGLPTSACLIDFQTARICSPAYDVLFLIASSTDGALRCQEYKNMLDIYYEQFESTLKESGLDARKIYRRDSFENDLRSVGPACLVVANTALWLASGLQEDGHVRSRVILKTEDEKKAAVESYKVIISNIIDDFRRYHYICACCC